ncbi:GTPase Obg, partial [Dissostichus eleginoides]
IPAACSTSGLVMSFSWRICQTGGAHRSGSEGARSTPLRPVGVSGAGGGSLDLALCSATGCPSVVIGSAANSADMHPDTL